MTVAACRHDPPAPGGRRPQSIRIERHGMIVELGDGVAADPVLVRAPVDDPGEDQARLHCRIRSDGLLAHAVFQVERAAIARFVLELDQVMRTGRGEANLAGGPRHPMALHIEADDGPPRMTLLACPASAPRTRVVVEVLELAPADLQSIRGWAADHR